ncbi:hypothetical protein L5515_019446 [Caenorhabditis briggsae]|uniref:ATP-dependent DNA helicase n=1 Tax=Caenorhabditis briggsae TaxID=6238 RepID=A0AAE9FJV5_CAEBR|nr:hypothetical protein L5515_019446 [Caenorhabditis briggsae]
MQTEGAPLPLIVVDGHELPKKSCAANPFYVLVHGQAGSGKSLLLKSIANGVRSHFEYDDSCIVTAPVAIAANLVGGKTIHSTFILEWGETSQPIDRFMANATDQILTNLSWMKKAKILLIDNINSVGAVDFARIDHRLQQVTGREKRFGGLSVIAFGDFHQVPPVKDLWIFEDLKPEYQEKAKEKTPESPEKLWTLFKIVELESQNWRDIKEQKFFNFMRDGFKEKEEELRKYLNDWCVVFPDQQETLDALVTYFQNIHDRDHDFAFLCVNDKIASDINDKIASNINAAIVESLGNWTVFRPEDSNKDRYAKKWKPNSKDLIVATGSPVVLLDNCQITAGALQQEITAGAIGRVEKITDHDISVRFPNGQQVQIKRLKYKSGGTWFQQFPLRLAYAHTVEKAQGATFDKIILVRNDTWNPKEIRCWGSHNFHGKLYTAMSRCRNLKNCGIIPMRGLQWVCEQKVPEELERMRRDNSLESNFIAF